MDHVIVFNVFRPSHHTVNSNTVCLVAVSCQVCCKGDPEPPCQDAYRGEAPWLPVLWQELHTGIPITSSYIPSHWWVLA